MMPAFMLLAIMALVSLPQQGRERDVDRAPVFDHLCGKLVRSEPMPLKGRFNTTSVQQSALGKTELLLYKRRQDAICCENMHPVTRTISGDDGAFEFKKIAADSYWVVVHLDGRDYKMAVKYSPDATAATRCSDFMFEAESSGTFELGKVIPFGK